MKRRPNDEPVPLHTALWLDNHERIEAMLKPCPFCGSKAFLCYTTDNKAMPYIKCGNFNSTGINTGVTHSNSRGDTRPLMKRQRRGTGGIYESKLD